ncbi:MAG: T9SS type A sorting domain-containing protein [Bacteroidota bacterium]
METFFRGSYVLLLLVSHTAFAQVSSFVFDTTLTNSSGPTGVRTPSHFPNIRLPQSAATAQMSPAVAIDPADESRIVVGTSNFKTGDDVIGHYLSTNFGKDWGGSTTTVSKSGPFESPSVQFNNFLPPDAPNLLFTYNDRTLGPGGSSQTILRIVASTDRGDTWELPAPIVESEGVEAPCMVVDNNIGSPHRGNIYLAYTTALTGPPYQIMFTRSIAGGNFTTPVPISTTVANEDMSRGVSMVILPSGDIFACWALYQIDSEITETGIGYTRSTDGGATWAPTLMIPIIGFIGANGNLEKGVPINLIAANSHPSVAFDPPSRLYIVWANKTIPCESQEVEQRLPDIWMVDSRNNGEDWDAARRISPFDACPRTDQWNPKVHVDQYEGVNVVYYDSEVDELNDYTQVTLARSVDNGLHWKYYQISDHKWIPAPAPTTQNYGGEYLGLSSTSEYLIIAWNDNRTGVHQTYSARFPLTQANVFASVEKGFNMMGIPVIVNNFAPNAVYPTAVEDNVFGYAHNGYFEPTELSCNRGWWVKFPGEQSLQYSGLLVESMGMAVGPGWNIIGSISAPVDASTVTSDPPGILASPFYSYAGGYQLASVLYPGGGFWVKTTQAGTLYLNGEYEGGIESVFDGYDRFTISDAMGNSQDLYVRNGTLLPPDAIPDIEMPPLPPPSFDARFASQKMLETVFADSGVVTLCITVDSAVAPVELSWDINPENDIEYNLVGPLGKPSRPGVGVGKIRFAETMRTIPITALARQDNSSSHPRESSLQQNFPNPFNPETEIRFDVAQSGWLTLIVYDILGRPVRILASGDYPRGSYAIRWNGSDEQGRDVASGLYLCQMVQSGKTITQKMVLVR